MPLAQVSVVSAAWTLGRQMLTPSGALQVLGLCLTDTCSRPGLTEQTDGHPEGQPVQGAPWLRNQSRGLGTPSRGCHCLLLRQQVSKG